MGTQTKLGFARTARAPSPGQPESSAFSRNGVSLRPSVVATVARPNVQSASAEIVRARDLLRDLLIRDDAAAEDSEFESSELVGQVSAGLEEICQRLDSLAGLQMMFEAWVR